MEVRFQHLEYEIADELIIRCGSPIFFRPDAGNVKQKSLLSGAAMMNSQTIAFLVQQVLSATGAFPEAAVHRTLRLGHAGEGER